jgi:transcriptional regulator with XRE-family HTH domain
MIKKNATFHRQVGLRIREARERRGLTQVELARKLGFTYQAVQKYEDGRNPISLKLACDIAKVLAVSPHQLAGFEPTPDANDLGRDVFTIARLMRPMPPKTRSHTMAIMQAVAKIATEA